MTPDRAALLARVEAFPIDGPDAPALPFAARLARENGWPRAYADRVVREYKRFAFLAAAGYGPVCPSEDVDAAWHLHLTYTRSYWQRFCGGVLGTPLHHEPTRGGPAEADKHLAMYAHTLAAYREAFGEVPPADIWTPAADRFGDDLRHRSVNTARNWVIPKRPVVRAAQLTAALVALAVAVPGCDGGANPFALVGTEFLAFLIPLLVAAVVAARVIKAARRGPDPYPTDADLDLTWERAAYLAGGAPRVALAAVARLAAAGLVREEGDALGRTDAAPPAGLSAAERAVLAGLPVKRTTPQALTDVVRPLFQAEADRLDADGFTVPAARANATKVIAFLPVLVVLMGFGLPRLIMGLAADKPVDYLVATLLVGGVIGMATAFAGTARLTRRGEAALARHRERYAALRTDANPDVGLAVGLFGTAVLVGTTAAYLRAWYPRQAAAGSDAGCGSGCGAAGGGGCGGGGGGCGGGGCGGCGGS